MTLEDDSEEHKCIWYYSYPNACGSFDTDDFHANEDCCACIDYQNEVSTTIIQGECDTTDQLDSGGDSCEWYYTRSGACGVFDTEYFHAFSDCCACQFIPEPTNGNGACDSTDFVGSDNHGCTWYYGREMTCGMYDTEDFHADEDCCACKGCDTTAALDSDENKCDYYYEHADECGDHDTEEFSASAMCCACQIIGEPEPTPEAVVGGDPMTWSPYDDDGDWIYFEEEPEAIVDSDENTLTYDEDVVEVEQTTESE